MVLHKFALFYIKSYIIRKLSFPPLDMGEFRPRAGFEVHIIEFPSNAVRIAITHGKEYRDYVFRIDGAGDEFP